MAPVLAFSFTRSSRFRTPRRWIVLAAASCLLFAAWYIIAANAVVSSSYRLSDTEAKRTELLSEIDSLKATIAAQGAPEAVEAKAKALGFVPVSKASYLPVPGTTVAVRESIR